MNSYASISQLLGLSCIGNEAADRRNIESAIDNLLTRLATVEAERGAAVERVTDCETRIMRIFSKLESMQAERDAAREASEKDREWVGRALEKQAEYLGQSQMLVAERDAARAEVAHMKREQQAMIMQHRHDIRDLGHLLQDERCKVATIEAAWYAARAGEARAVKALRAVVAGASPHEEETWTIEGAVLRHVHRVLDRYEPTPDKQPTALDWIAQQRREAAVEALEKLEAECSIVFYGDLPHVTIEEIREHLAALRAGEVGNE